ncbi:hypothetical protein CPC08DRAFT_799658 [Agrocybe pediades]|nr:hypothetical protein CPC08DRAFT_799658 [Agrocybe pediades]
MNSNRPFAFDRLASFAGYVLPPTVVDAMLFLLPCFTLCSHRIVENFQRSWELWSPNSTRSVFYPGAQEFGTRFGRSLSVSMRRYDGHEGRFDPTVSPQHFDKGRPWLGFIQTSPDISRPEFNSFANVWVRDKSGYSGKFDSSFVLQLAKRVHVLYENVNSKYPLAAVRPDLWKKRPSIPTKDDVVHLNLMTKWEDAIDYYTELQREVKYMAAWCKMADAYISYSKDRPEIEKVMPANETLMGVWMNGCDEEEGKWLIANRVPCFIIHELTAKESRDWVIGSKRVSDFQTGTGAVRLRVAANPLDQFAKKGGNALLDLNWELGQASASDHEYLPTDKDRSSITAQGWRNGAYYDPKKIVIVKDRTPSIPTVTASGYRLPPPVTCAVDLGGWSKWTEEELEDEEYVLLCRGKGYSAPEHSYEYYDRIHNRRVYLNSPIAMPSNYKANPWIYGLPAPSMRYVELEGHKKYGVRKQTTWVYFVHRPDEDDVGRCYSTDRADDQYDGRVLPGFEPESDEDMEPDVNDEEDDDTDHVSIPDDDFDHGAYSSNPAFVTVPSPVTKEPSPGPPVARPLDPVSVDAALSYPTTSRQKSPNLSTKNHRDRPSHQVILRTISPRRLDQRLRSPSPQRSAPHEVDTYHSRRTPSAWSLRRPHSPQRDYPRHQSRSPAPYESRYKYGRTVANNSYDSRGRSFRTELGSSRDVVLSQSDRHWSPSHSPSPVQEPFPDRKAHDSWRDRTPPSPAAADDTQSLLPQKRGQSPSPDNPPPSRLSLLDRLSQPTENALVSYDAQTASLKSGLLALAAPSSASLTIMFPTPAIPHVPVLRTINEKGRSRFLILWNMPAYRFWENVIMWINAVLTLVPSSILTRVTRMNEGGQQVFWLAFRKADHASSFRGQVSGRIPENGIEPVGCDFVSPELYCSATGSQPPSWFPSENKFSDGITAHTLLAEKEAPRQPSRALAELLGLEPGSTAVWTHRKSRRSRKKKQDPADGGAL